MKNADPSSSGRRWAFKGEMPHRTASDNRDAPAIAEVSFSYDTDHGAGRAEAARRALDLLLAMQDLEWADPAAPTKTALVGCVD